MTGADDIQQQYLAEMRKLCRDIEKLTLEEVERELEHALEKRLETEVEEQVLSRYRRESLNPLIRRLEKHKAKLEKLRAK